MKVLFFKVFGFLVLLWLTGWNANSQFIGIPKVKTYPFSEYGAGGQNYQIEIAPNGMIYVANNFGLLRFDGQEWRLFAIPGGTKVRSLLCDGEDRIYIGAQNEFGYFQPNSKGQLTYISLKSSIDGSFTSFDDVWKIHKIKNDVVFSTTGLSYIWDGSKMQTIKSSNEPGFTLKHNEELLTKQIGQQVVQWTDREWTPVSSQPPSIDYALVSILTVHENRELWFTRKSGIWMHEVKSQRFSKANMSKELKGVDITVAVLMEGGEIAVGTQSDGLYIFSKAGSLIYHFNKDRGLNSLTVNDIFQDNNGALWVTLNNNIVKIHWTYPFSFIDDQVGLPGTGYAAISFENKLYMGTNNGLYVTPTAALPMTRVERVSQVNGQINNIQVLGGELLVSAHDGAYVQKDGKWRSIDNSTGWWGFEEIEENQRLIGGSYDGIGLFINTSKGWELVKKYTGFKESSRVLAYNGGDSLWMAHGYKGIYNISFTEDFDEINEVKYFGVESGLPSLYLNNVFKVGDELIFGTESGLFKFSDTAQQFQRHPYFDTLVGPDVHTRYITTNDLGDVYLLTNQYCGILKKDKWRGYQLSKEKFNGIFPLLNDDLAQISILDNNHVLFTANNGFVHYNSDYGDIAQELKTKLKQVKLLLSGEVIRDFYSASIKNNRLFDVPYESNSIAFEYTAINNQFDQSFYSYRLEGFKDENWSEWSMATTKEFTNLYEGNYQFQVKSRDVFGNTSPVVSFSFSVKPPWYRSSWSYVTYVAIFLSTFFISFSLYRRKHKKETSQLIEKQTHEIQIKETELTQLKNEKLESEINLKKRQLASSTMHLLDKNELLGKIKSQLSHMANDNQLESSAKELKRLVKEIDKNIDKDQAWDQFELHFDEVHGDFLKRLGQAYDNLTPQEIKLSAYLRMNMSTKEIANLMKISVRGVEIARYRLRKKLSLEQSQNLVDFMIKF